MKIDRVILASDSHINYLPFWKYAAKSWARLGIKPTLFLIDNNNVDDINVDTELGDVYRLNCGDNMHTAFVSQCIRLLCPAMFLDESVIIADIDHFPLSYKYFFGNIKHQCRELCALPIWGVQAQPNGDVLECCQRLNLV